MSNSISFVGRVGTEPDPKLVGENYILEFRVAENVYMGKGKDDNCNWYSVTLWNAYAKSMVANITKGKEFFIRGELLLEEYEKDGAKRISAKINNANLSYVGKKDA